MFYRRLTFERHELYEPYIDWERLRQLYELLYLFFIDIPHGNTIYLDNDA